MAENVSNIVGQSVELDKIVFKSEPKVSTQQARELNQESGAEKTVALLSIEEGKSTQSEQPVDLPTIADQTKTAKKTSGSNESLPGIGEKTSKTVGIQEVTHEVGEVSIPNVNSERANETVPESMLKGIISKISTLFGNSKAPETSEQLEEMSLNDSKIAALAMEEERDYLGTQSLQQTQAKSSDTTDFIHLDKPKVTPTTKQDMFQQRNLISIGNTQSQVCHTFSKT